MSFDLTPLLLHSDEVPAQAKVALAAAREAPPGHEQDSLLETAARALYRGTPLGCDEVRDLVGLPPGTC